MARKILKQEKFDVLIKRGLSAEQIFSAVEKKGGRVPSSIRRRSEGKPTGLARVSKVFGDIFGGKVIGEAIGTGIAKRKIKREFGEEAVKFVEPAPTPRQVAADVATTALGVLPVTRIGAKALQVGKLGARVLKTAALGAGISAAATLREEELVSLDEVGRSLLTGAAVGAAIPIVGAGLTAIGRAIKAIPERLIRSAMKQSKKALLAGKDISKFVLENKKIGTANKLIFQSEKVITTTNSKIKANLSRVPGKPVKISNIFSEVTKISEAEGALLTVADVKKAISTLAPQTKKLIQKDTLNLIEANQLRQLVDRTIGDRGFLTTQDPFNKTILKAFANNLRNLVKDTAPKGTRRLFETLSNEITLKNALIEANIGKSRNQLISFGDLIGGGLGTIVAPGFGTIVGLGARRALESVAVKTAGAVGIQEAIRVATPILRKLAPAQRAIILNLLRIRTQEKE